MLIRSDGNNGLKIALHPKDRPHCWSKFFHHLSFKIRSSRSESFGYSTVFEASYITNDGHLAGNVRAAAHRFSSTETWVIPRGWNKWRLEHWFNTSRLLCEQTERETRSKSIRVNYPRELAKSVVTSAGATIRWCFTSSYGRIVNNRVESRLINVTVIELSRELCRLTTKRSSRIAAGYRFERWRTRERRPEI